MVSSNVVVASQPTATPPVTVVAPQLKRNPMVMIVTIVLTAACLTQGNWPALVCLTPALIAAVVGFSLSDAASEEQRHTAKAFHAVAICCNIATVIYYILMVVAVIITVGTIFGIRNSVENTLQRCIQSCAHSDNYFSSSSSCSASCY